MVMGRKALDPRWTRHHTPVAEAFMLATIRVTRKVVSDSPSYNFETGQYENVTITEVWTGQARIQPYGIIGDQIVAQDPTGRRLMRVQVADITPGIIVDDAIMVTDAPDNPELESFELEVRGTIGSSNAWLTDLVCEANVKEVNLG